MEKLDKKEKIYIFLICGIFLAIALIITHGEYVFGSEIDWGFQHVVFPDYFRRLFYATGDLFPDFALNIGGGQNIYYFAYYGLLSPIVLISYLLPFVPMSFYMIFMSLLLGVISIYLFYHWIRGFKFSFKLNVVLTLLFAMAAPFLFHSHRHIMFVSYMPFLILGLIGVRRYFDKGYKGLMIISVFLMIMTSYYYSVGGILCMTVYGVYEYLSKIEKFSVKDFFKKALSFASLIITGILMAGVLLLPVIYTLLNGRGESYETVSWLEAITPSLNLDFILYDTYSVGLLGITLVAIFYLIFLKKEKRFLGILLSLLVVFPLFVYLLNGALYLDGKALIPFLPLYVLGTGLFLKQVFSGQANYKIILGIVVVCLLWACLEGSSYLLYFTIDLFVLVLLLCLYKRFKKDLIVFIPVCLAAVLMCTVLNMDDSLISLEDFGAQNDPVLEEIIDDIAQEDNGLYRMVVNLEVSSQLVNRIYSVNENVITLYSSTYNTAYSNLFYKFNNNRSLRNMFIISEDKNTLFESLMGVKYLVSDKEAPLGYEVWKEYGDYTVYVNENTLPLGYATDRVISYQDYDKLDYPDDSLALIGNVVALNGDYEYESLSQEISLELDGDMENLDIWQSGDGYKVEAFEDGGTLKVKLDEDSEDNFYLLRITLEDAPSCDYEDLEIEVNGIKNKLTCKDWKYFNDNYTFDYTISSDEEFEYLTFEFSEGVYEISEVQLYRLSYDDFILSMEDIDEFVVDEVLGDKITGTIDVTNDGYFNLSIPYDDGFVIKVDGEEVEYEKVNEAFIGFALEAGSHTISIEFEAPNALAGKIISIVGIGIFIGIMVYQRKKVTNK